ncbi:hypothetical protein V7S43_018949 [Phytophthora oleae]|uniref:RxLR effector protein n=1 Tax=Phytophthora oleae TaxID=2107226 RepID=A0ABD3ET87_9STRA
MMAILGAVSAADQPLVKTPADALEKIQATALPDGVTLTGTTEKIDPPADAAATDPKEVAVNKDDDKTRRSSSAGVMRFDCDIQRMMKQKNYN